VLALALLAPACAGPKRAIVPPADRTLIDAKGDPHLLAAVEENRSEPFAAFAVFTRDAFLGQSAMLESSSITLLNEFGNAAIVLLRPAQVLPLLRDPSVRRIAWFGPQGRLARLDPSLELDLLSRYGKGTERKEIAILARYQYVPADAEVRHAADAGFRIAARAGPNLVLTGPASGVAALLSDDAVVYLEKSTGTSGAEAPGAKVTQEAPHASDTISGIRDRQSHEPAPPQPGGAIPFRTYPRDNAIAAPSGPAPQIPK
jgi:hypothetical protein